MKYLLLAVCLLFSGCTLRVYKTEGPPPTVVYREYTPLYIHHAPRVHQYYHGCGHSRFVDFRATGCINLNPNVCKHRGY